MGHLGERLVRNRGRNQRLPTVREIKMAICTHDRLAVAGPPEQRSIGGAWRAKLSCPSCGAWEVRETPDAPIPAAVASAAARQEIEATPAWEDCSVELRCQDRGVRVYPLCRYDAIARGSAGLYVAARSVDFDNGIEQAERAAILDGVVRDLQGDGWEPESVGNDSVRRFRRRSSDAVAAAALARVEQA